MSTQHTPGPWRVDDERGFDRIEIIGRPDYPCRRFEVMGEWRVAELDDLMGDYPEVVAANARLIAAAPDLLKALQAIAGNNWNDQSRARHVAREAIAKATGAA